MPKFTLLLAFIFIISSCNFISQTPTIPTVSIPVHNEERVQTPTSTNTPTDTLTATTTPTPITVLEVPIEFLESCKANSLYPTCIYSPNSFALHIDYGSKYNLPISGARLWDDAWHNGNIVSILAHNYYDGKFFFSLEIGSPVYLIWSTGKYEKYLIVEKTKWVNVSKWISFSSPSENLLLDENKLFSRYYRGGVNYEKIVLQTCTFGTNGIMFFTGTRQ